MRVLLVRHAEAAPGDPDELRELTDTGRRQAGALGAELAAQGVQPAVILTSPLVRARQTAQALGEALGADVEIDERLAPGATPDSVREAVDGRGDTVVTVGHQPECSWIATRARRQAGRGLPAGGRRRAGAAVSAIEVSGLRKSYESTEAVRGITFAIADGRGLRPARPERRRQDDDRRDPRGLPRARRG